jgi:osmotically-inducible protein OsmY
MKLVRLAFSMAVALAFAGSAYDARAQSPADAKRTLKAWEAFYVEPGMAEADVRYMRGTLLITGYVPTEEHMKKADELAKTLKGVKEVRNRLRVREPIVAAGGDAEICAKIDQKVEEDEETQKAKAKGQLEIKCEGGGNVTVSGKVNDYTVASSLINDVRKTDGIRTINFSELKY